MDTGTKRYSVVIRGRVQDVGFRDLVTQLANFFGLRGYIFNDVDGSVRVIIEGAKETLDSFFEDIKVKMMSIGAEIEGIDKREVARDFDLPPKFMKIATTEFEEIGKKLDIGIYKLKSMDGRLGSIDGKLGFIDGKLGSIDGRLDNIDGRLGSIDGKLGSIDGRLDGIDGRLGNIDGRLDSIDGKLGFMDEKLGSIDGRLGSMDKNLCSIDGKLGSMDHKLEKLDKLDILVDGQEKMLKVLETIASK